MEGGRRHSTRSARGTLYSPPFGIFLVGAAAADLRPLAIPLTQRGS